MIAPSPCPPSNDHPGGRRQARVGIPSPGPIYSRTGPPARQAPDSLPLVTGANLAVPCGMMEEMADFSAESLLECEEIVKKLFASEDEGFEFYNNYAFDKGFSVRKTYVEWDDAKTEIILWKFVCSRQGFREEKYMNKETKRRPRDITRVGCQAKLVIARDQETGWWFVKDFTDGHNHGMLTRDLVCFLRSHRKISDEQKADIVEMEISGIRKHQIMDILEMQYGGYDNVGCTSRDLYNFCYRHKQETIVSGDAETVIRHLKARQEEDPEFFFKFFVDGDNHLQGLFWCDSQSQLDYEAFGDVVVFDSTYRTNRYNLPFVPFVGLNHHRSTIIFGCGIISYENSESYEWMLRTFSEAMSQKHPMSVITDGDLAMQRAIRVVWPNTHHRLCVWHIEQNIVRNLHDDKVKDEFRPFLYDCWHIQESERKWYEFLEKHKVTSEESWLHQMYQMRHLWCASYQVGHCFLGLRSNQRSESLNSVLHKNLDKKMSLFDMLQHYEHCLSGLRRNEAEQDSRANSSFRFTKKDASKIEVEASKQFTPTVFFRVQWSIHAANKCIVSEILDGCDTSTFIVAKKDKMETKYEVHCKMVEDSLNEIACSCQKLECVGTPCSHIFHVLQLLHVDSLPKSCVLDRWTMNAKCAFPPIRNSNIYAYSKSLVRYRDLRNLSHAASFRAAQSNESYQRLKRVLLDETDSKTPCGNGNGRIRYGPMITQALEVDGEKVLDPMHVPGRGAPKKKIKTLNKKERGKVKCSLCKDVGHNRRSCAQRKEETKLAEDL